jgi:hypothetical protein
MAAGYMTADQAAAITRTETGRPGAGSYIAAVLVPFAGFVLAIRAFAKDKIGPGLALALTAWLAMTVWAALFFAVALNDVTDAFSSSSDTSSLVDPSSTDSGVTDDTGTSNSVAGGGTGTFSADDTDGDGVNDDIDADPYDASVQ